MAEKVMMYKTEDGKLFDTRGDAEAYEERKNIEEFIDDELLTPHYANSACEVMDFLTENKTLFIDYLTKL